MSVVLSGREDWFPELGKCTCTVCGEVVRSHPFVFWNGTIDIVICRSCIPGVRQGLSADLIHAVAVLDLQSCGYPNFTLVRTFVNRVPRRP